MQLSLGLTSQPFLLAAADHCTPKVRIGRGRKCKTWLSDETLKLIKCKRLAFKMARRSNSESALIEVTYNKTVDWLSSQSDEKQQEVVDLAVSERRTIQKALSHTSSFFSEPGQCFTYVTERVAADAMFQKHTEYKKDQLPGGGKFGILMLQKPFCPS